MEDGLKKKTPFLKWAGGKTQILTYLQERLPDSYNNYYEPFIGGGALLLSVSPHQAVINDINEELINIYIQLKKSCIEVVQIINEYDKVSCDKDFYLEARKKYNEKIKAHELDTESAALMIWLNKHCFNGLYRVNSEGLFNVSYNNKTTGKSVNEDNLKSVGEYLKKNDIKISSQDFEEVCDSVSSGDFVYFDPPYVPESDTADFTGYTKEGFSLEDHKRLAKLFKDLDKKGAYVMLSNNDVSLVRELYDGFNIQPIDVKRMINRDASKRTGKEVIITNY